MSGLGMNQWTQPWHGESFVLDGLRFEGDYDFQAQPTDQPVARVRMASGKDIRVRRLEPIGLSPGGSYYVFGWTMVPDQEAEWHRVRRIATLGETVWLVPYMVETEAWRSTGGAQTFTMRRPTAESVFAAFEDSLYQTAAYVNGVVQTVVDTGTPATGEVYVNGAQVTVPSDTGASDLIEVRYYPAFPVDIDRAVLSVETHNVASVPVTAAEAGGVVPSSI